jgi:hypothetical protein
MPYSRTSAIGAGPALRGWRLSSSPPVVVAGAGDVHASSFLETSENLVVESLRREGGHIELRMVECLGYAGMAQVTLRLPHGEAFLTDMLGGNPQRLTKGPHYSFPIRAQQIVTLRFAAVPAVAAVRLLTQWDDLVPENKRAMLHEYSAEKGHPPRGA